METKKIAVLVGTVITIIVFGIVLWFLIPSSKIDEKVTVNGDATVEMIGMAYTLIDLHSVSALWSGSTMVLVFVVFLIQGCCCKNKALKRIHSHVKAKLKDEFVQIGSEFAVSCRLAPDTSNTTVGAQEGDQVGYQAATSVLGIQAAVERQALLERKARRDRARQEMEELEDKETRLDIEHKKAMLESKKQAPRGEVELYGRHGVADYGRHEVAGYGQQGAVGGGGGGSIQRSQYYSNESYGDG